ncbi:MAG: hypothetical protein ACLSHM_01720 [Vescimonas sp.]
MPGASGTLPGGQQTGDGLVHGYLPSTCRRDSSGSPPGRSSRAASPSGR